MDEDMYSDSPDSGGMATMDKKESKEGMDETFLVPKAVFGGQETEPGSRWEFEVVGEHGDEVQMKYYTPPKKEKSSEMPKKEVASESSGEMGMSGMYD